MKKAIFITLLFIFHFLSFNCFSQTGSDTLWGAFRQGTDTLYHSPGGGYVGGNNVYGDRQKAQAYHVTEKTAITDVLLLFGAKVNASGDSTSGILVNIYKMNYHGQTNAGGVNSPAPGNVVSSVFIPIGNIITNGFTVAHFDYPVIVHSDSGFAVGIEVDSTYLKPGDTLGLISTSNHDAALSELSWEQQENENWYSLLNAWGLDIDLAIFPVRDTVNVGIHENKSLTGSIKSECYPNPNRGDFFVRYEIEDNAAVSLEINDLTGKLLYRKEEGKRSAGNYSIPVSNLPPGCYFYSLKAGEERINGKVVVGGER